MALLSFGGHPLVIAMSVRRVVLHMLCDDTNFFKANYMKYLDVIWMNVLRLSSDFDDFRFFCFVSMLCESLYKYVDLLIYLELVAVLHPPNKSIKVH